MNYLNLMQINLLFFTGQQCFLMYMFVRCKKYSSGKTGVIVAEKVNGRMRELKTIGISNDDDEIELFVIEARKWVEREEARRYPRLDLFGHEREACEREIVQAEEILSRVSNILINGCDLILDRVFDAVGFDKIEDAVFRHLVKARLSYPASKAATVEYLKNYFDEDVNLSRIYRYLDRLNDSQRHIVQDISVHHTMEILGNGTGVLFYDVTTLYFETDREDELRKTGFSKEGKHSHPQIILGLLVSFEGYPLAYTIHEGNKYEGHTMLPVIKDFVRKYRIDDFIVVADSGLMNNDNIKELEQLGYRYIIGAKIKNESATVRDWILSQPKINGVMVEYDKGPGRRLLTGYTDERARKDSYNREKGVHRLEKNCRSGRLTKDSINQRGYNKFLNMDGETRVSINCDRLKEDALWDGLKGYLTNTELPTDQIYTAYHNLWNVEKAFRIAKSKIEIRPMFHFTRRRIEAHICICFVALKVYKELERRLKCSDIKMSVDKVLAMAQTITTIEINLPKNKDTLRKTLIMNRHKKIAPLFDDDFWVTR
jgi:transposase